MITPNSLATEPVSRLIWRFALPGMISTLINSLHNIVDQAFAGWGIGELAIAATNVTFPVAMITTALASLLGMGGAALFSLSMGRGEQEKAAKSMGNSIFFMLLFGLVLGTCAVVFAEPMLFLFGATEKIMPYARPYAVVICAGLPLAIFSVAMTHFVRADGDPKFSSAISLSGAIFNMVFDPVFLFVFDMGIEGIALATVLGQLLSACLALYYLLKKMKTVRLEKADYRPSPSITKKIFSLGGAPCFNHIIMTTSQILLMNSLRFYGAQSVYGSEIAIAGAGAVGKISMVLLSVIIGIALGCQPIHGFNYGSKRYGRVKETYLTSVKYGTIVAVAAFLLLQLFPNQLLSVFGSEDPLFYEFSIKYIRIYLFMTFVNALQPITSTFFTVIGKPGVGFWMTLIRQGLLLIPLLLILPRIFGLDGIFWAGPISDGIAAAVVITFAAREMKLLARMQQEQDKLSAQPDYSAGSPGA